LLLDVDGVLNPACRPRDDAGFRRHLVLVDGCEFAVWRSRGHGRWLRDLAGVAGFELTWATSWEHQASRW
jgi:hypothetical protein